MGESCKKRGTRHFSTSFFVRLAPIALQKDHEAVSARASDGPTILTPETSINSSLKALPPPHSRGRLFGCHNPPQASSQSWAQENRVSAIRDTEKGLAEGERTGSDHQCTFARDSGRPQRAVKDTNRARTTSTLDNCRTGSPIASLPFR
jgi:hypothetical protein